MKIKSKFDKKSRAKEIKTLLKKTKKLIGTHLRTIPFKQPIVFLIRNNKNVEFYEEATTGTFEFEHTNGKQYKIYLDGTNGLLDFGYGEHKFKGYILHEDNAFPLPEKPIHNTIMVNALIDKTLHDIKSWTAKELEAKAKVIWYLLGGIAVIILAYALLKILMPATPTPIQPIPIA